MVSCDDKPWLKSYERNVPGHIAYERTCMPEYLDRAADSFPDRDALIFEGYRLTFRELKDMVDRFASFLAHRGISKGDAVAVLLPNTIPCVVSYYAILKCGAIAVMNNPLSANAELEYQFSNSGSRLLITLDRLLPRMIRLRPKTPVREIISTAIEDYLPFPKKLVYPFFAKRRKKTPEAGKAPDVYSWKGCLAGYDPALPSVRVDFETVAMYQYTGGTSGTSKGVILTHGNLSTQVQMLQVWFSRFARGREIMLGALPFFHVFGLSTVMNFAVSMAWTNVLVPNPKGARLLEAIRKYRPTFAPLVPTMYVRMLAHPDLKKTDMTCLRGCFSGSEPLPVEVIHDFEHITGATIVEGFGLTETSPVTHINPFSGAARKVGSVGVPVPDTCCRIVSTEDGVTDVPVGAQGELIVSGPQVMKGYKDMPRETDQTIRDGWCYTGDIATMDDDGYFYIVDRMKDMIISGGYNIYPREIEEVLGGHPKVREVCAIGVPDPRRGECVKVFIVLKEGETATGEALKDYCRTRMAKYKIPREIEFRETLPGTGEGADRRKELKAEELMRRQEP